MIDTSLGVDGGRNKLLIDSRQIYEARLIVDIVLKGSGRQDGNLKGDVHALFLSWVRFPVEGVLLGTRGSVGLPGDQWKAGLGWAVVKGSLLGQFLQQRSRESAIKHPVW